MSKREFTVRYKVRNWAEYNRALIRRGQLTLWIDEAAVDAWNHAGNDGGRGRPKVYTDAALVHNSRSRPTVVVYPWIRGSP